MLMNSNEYLNIVESIKQDIRTAQYLGSEDSCARFFELFSTVVVIPILLSSLASLPETVQGAGSAELIAALRD